MIKMIIRKCVDYITNEEIKRRTKQGLLEEMNKRFDRYKSNGIKVSMYSVDSIYYLINRETINK